MSNQLLKDPPTIPETKKAEATDATDVILGVYILFTLIYFWRF